VYTQRTIWARSREGMLFCTCWMGVVDRLLNSFVSTNVCSSPLRRESSTSTLFSQTTISSSLLRESSGWCPACTELCHRDVGMYDRVVIQDILKEIAQTQQVDLNAKQRFKGDFYWQYSSPLAATNPNSGHHQRSRRAFSRRSSCTASDNGKVYDEHASHPMRK
jgi:hypothetical protein